MSFCSVNVNLTSILQKWHSTEYIGRSIVIEGDELSRRNMFVDAIMKYSEALEYGECAEIIILDFLGLTRIFL